MNTAPAMLASVSLAVSILQSNENTSMETTNQTDIVRNFLYIYLLFYLFPCANPIGGVAPLAGDISLRRQQTVGRPAPHLYGSWTCRL